MSRYHGITVSRYHGITVFRPHPSALAAAPRSLRYLGVMTIDNDALFLPLKQGENELIFAVSEAFGGWGVTARLEDLAGIRLEY